MKQLIPLLALTACTHHRPLTAAVGRDVEVEVTTAPGVEVTARAEAGPSGVVLHSAYGDIRPDQITRMTENSSGMGLLEGLAIGTGVGFVGGAAIGLASGDDDCSSDMDCTWTFTGGEKAVLLGIVFGGIGGTIGLVIGAISGATYVYDTNAPAPRIIPTGPPGSVGGVTIKF